MTEYKKREIAHKLKIGDILRGSPIVEDVPQETPDPNQTSSATVKERFRFMEIDDRRVVRVNVIANIIEKYQSEGEKKYASVTIDDASGQIRLKVFGEDTAMFNDLVQGDTIIIVGVLRSYNGEVYILPEIVKKADPRYLLIRKLELEKSTGKKPQPDSEQSFSLKDQIIDLIRSSEDAGGVSTEDIILKIKNATPESISSEIVKMIEDGMIYEPRPGKVRWLG